MSRTRQTRTRVRPASLVGRSTAYERLCAEIDHHAGHRLPLLITGEPGVGKLAVATAVHECGGTSGPVSVHDAALCEIDEPSDWLGTVRTRLADPTGTVIILHGDLLDTARARALCGVIDTQSRPGGARLIATWTNGTQEANGTRFLLDRLPCSIDVPPLRDHPEDVPDLVHAFIDRHAPAGATARSSADVLQVLMRLEWPGNIRELECLICNLLLRRRQGDITLEDLPPRYQSTGARTPLTRMERLERDAIVTALRACGGNRIEAAANLGISRSTLYRKMKGYRISTVGVQTFDS